MKQFSAFLFALICASGLSAQSLTLSQYTLDMEIGDVLDYEELFITNTGDADIELGVALDVDCYEDGDGLKMQICIGPQCFEPVNTDSEWEGTETSPLLTITPGEVSGALSIHQFFTGTAGSQWTITFYDRNNPGDMVDLVVNIGVCANNISEVPALSASAAYPNPASASVNIDFDVTTSPALLQVFDLVGNVVKVITLENAQGTAKVDVSDLNNGVYFYSLSAGQFRSEVKSLVVSH